jgi:signal transduction histidine kinase
MTSSTADTVRPGAPDDSVAAPALSEDSSAQRRFECLVHDLSNVLTPLLVLSEYLELELPDGDPLRVRLSEISASAQRAQALVQRAVGELREERALAQPISVGPLLLALRGTLQSTCGSRIQLDLQEPARNAVARVDPHRLESALIDLVANARDAISDAGVITIRVATLALDEEPARARGLAPARYVLIEVTDTGVGISAALRERIFERLFTTKRRGSGLGLYNVRCFVEAYQGAISVASVEGGGATFSLYLPESE